MMNNSNTRSTWTNGTWTINATGTEDGAMCTATKNDGTTATFTCAMVTKRIQGKDEVVCDVVASEGAAPKYISQQAGTEGRKVQMAAFMAAKRAREEHVVLDLHSYDAIVISSSAGKDSQAMLTMLVQLADTQGYDRSRLVVVHADLAETVEWDGVVELAREQAEHYGVRFHVVSRVGQIKTQGKEAGYKLGEAFTDIPDYADRRGRWPGIGATQWCTGDFKTSPIRAYTTELAREIHAATGKRPRILSCLGLRAAESMRRAKRPAITCIRNTKPVHVDEWCPILWWSVAQVWDTIHASGVRYHEAYDRGMRRLSCCFCIGASMNDLLIAGSANEDKLRRYVAIEDRIGFTFQPKRSLRQVLEVLEATGFNHTAPSTAANYVEDNEDLNLVEDDSQPCDSWTGDTVVEDEDQGTDQDDEDAPQALPAAGAGEGATLVLRGGRYVTTARLEAGVVVGSTVYSQKLDGTCRARRALAWRLEAGQLVVEHTGKGLPAAVGTELEQAAAGLL
jgi:3'-phosphoadenosine 5'-phosphosulfate sulfotransferase (PAPS reductase)/FAD synthetase